MRYQRIGLGVVLVAALLTGGCGGDNPAKQPSTAATDYASCLRANGVTFPSGGPRGSGRPSGQPRPSGSPGERRGGGGPSGGPGGGPGGGFGDGQVPNGVDPSAWAKAQEACGGMRPSGGSGFGNDSAFQAYRTCLSDHGVTLSGQGQNLDESDPKVAAAVQACAPLRPSRGPRPSPSG